jgi:hypothetical protein
LKSKIWSRAAAEDTLLTLLCQSGFAADALVSHPGQLPPCQTGRASWGAAFFRVFKEKAVVKKVIRKLLTQTGLRHSVPCNEVGQSDREHNDTKKGLAAGPFSFGAITFCKAG